jgi:hypothetical protein
MRAPVASTAFAAAALFTAGCYTTTTIAPGDVRRLSKPSATPVQVARSGWEGTRLGPRTALRARLRDGTVSSWFRAGSMSTSPDGLLTGNSLSLGQMRVAVARDLGPNGSALASFLAPPGATVSLHPEGIALRGAPGADVARWAAAVSLGSLSAGGPGGRWTFYEPRSGWIAEDVDGEDLAAVPVPAVGRLRVMEGIPWSNVAGVELNNFDPLTTVAVGAGAALIIAFMVATAKSGVDPTPVLDVGVRTGLSAAESRQEEDLAPQFDDDGQHHGFLIDPASADETLAASPLFTPGAQRRDVAKLLLSVDSAWDGHAGITGAAGLGVRLFDFVELGARARVLHLGVGTVDGEAPAPAHLLFGGRLAFHIDGDAQPLTALMLGAEVLAGRDSDNRTITMTTLSVGPRFGIGRKTFLGLLFQPSYISADMRAASGVPAADSPTAPSEWRLMFGAEVGLAL